MDYNDQGYFIVTFTPSETAAESVKDGMNIEWYVGLSDGKNPLALDAYQYTFGGTSTNIIEAIDSTAVLVEIAGMENANGVYTFTIDMDDVVSKITLSSIKLDSKDKYDVYLTALKNGFIHVHAEVVENT